MQLLDGIATSNVIKSQIKQEVDSLIQMGKRRPHLAAVLIGENGASLTYVGAKVKACEAVGFESTLIHKSEATTEEEVLRIVRQLNDDPTVDGYIVQLPLPKHINETAVLLAIDPKKDVDGFHPENVGRMALNLPTYLPATPYGIIQLLKHYNVETAGKHCVV
jgi:methylenetetrahydrofolate dehydrogenase (NADP+) / methenyltetrahydrofolate cyclohydrolase